MQQTAPSPSPSPSDASSYMSHISSAHESSSIHPYTLTSKPAAETSESANTADTVEDVQDTPPSQEAASDDDDDEPWYAVRDIIDEKKQGRRLLYFVDWEDNPVTGEVYEPTWVPAKDVNEGAIRDWEKTKRARQAKATKTGKATKGVKKQPAKKQPKKQPPKRQPARRQPAKKKVNSQSSYTDSGSSSSRSSSSSNNNNTNSDSNIVSNSDSNSSAISGSTNSTSTSTSTNTSATSQESRPLTPPDAAHELVEAPSSNIRKRRLARAVLDDSDISDDEVVPASKRRRTSVGHDKSQSQSLSLSQSQTQSQSLSLLSSPPPSRTTSVDINDRLDREPPSSELDEPDNHIHIAQHVVETVETVELRPGSQFDPDEYVRLSQFPTQTQSQARDSSPLAPLAPLASLRKTPDAAGLDAAPHLPSPSIASPHQASAHTIPDSQEESLLISTPGGLVSQPQDQAEAEGEADADTDDQQPAQAQEEPEPPATQDNNGLLLRESADWASSAVRDKPENTRDSGSGSGSDRISITFLTQPTPDFSLLSSQSLQCTPLPAQTPVSIGPSNTSHTSNSVVPDSTRPPRTSTMDEDSAPQRKVGRLEQALLDMVGESPEYRQPSLPPASSSTTDAPPPPALASTMAPSDPDAGAFMNPAHMTIAPPPPPPVTQGLQDPMFSAPLVIGGSANELLMSPTTAHASSSSHNKSNDNADLSRPQGTVAPGDLSFSDSMTGGALEVSPEPEDNAHSSGSHEAADDEHGSGQSDDNYDDNDHDHGNDDDHDHDHDDDHDHHDSPQPMEEDDVDVDNDDNDDNESDDSDEMDSSNPNTTTHEYVVTLPLAANTRQTYLDMIADKKNEETIRQFTNVFSQDRVTVPGKELVARVNDLLRRFLDLSDLPSFYDSLPPLSEEEMMKQAINTNAKFSFVYELLERISTLKKTVLILAGRTVILDYLEALVNSAGIPYERISSGSASTPPPPKHTHFGTLSVLLGNASELTVERLPAAADAIDLVIGFDHIARTSGLLGHYIKLSTANNVRSKKKKTSTRSPRLPKPITMLLVSAFTIEHADLRLELATTADDCERKNALLLCALECVPYLRDYVESNLPAAPHDAAKAFGQMIANPAAAPLDWQPLPLPDDVLDIYVQASGASQPTFTQAESISMGEYPLRPLKRHMDVDDDDGEEAGSKRVRRTAPIVDDQPPVSDTVKRALGGPLWPAGVGVGDGNGDGNDNGGDTAVVHIARDQLEALAAKVARLEDRLRDKTAAEAVLTARVDALERLNEGYAKTIRRCQARLLEATQERGVFQSERDAAKAALAAVEDKLAARTAALADARTQRAALATRLAEADALLAGDTAQPDHAQLGQLRMEQTAARDRIAALERKVANADQDLDHARHAYQDASNAAADLSAENRDLGARVKTLEHQAALNLRAIHEGHQRSEADAYRAQWAEAYAMLRERECELEWTREELRVLKNGRRETRQQSVPRSPRPSSVISPRTVAGGGHGHRGGSANGGSSSSGTPVAHGHGHGAGYAAAARQSVSRGNSPVSASSPSNHGGGGNGNGNGSGSGNGGSGGGPPVPGLTYITPSQGGGRWGHLRE